MGAKAKSCNLDLAAIMAPLANRPDGCALFGKKPLQVVIGDTRDSYVNCEMCKLQEALLCISDMSLNAAK